MHIYIYIYRYIYKVIIFLLIFFAYFFCVSLLRMALCYDVHVTIKHLDSELQYRYHNNTEHRPVNTCRIRSAPETSR